MSTVRNTFLTIMAALALSPWQSLNAESLIIDGIDADRGRAVRGVSMATLKARWGEPQTTRGAIGEPPITRWEYADYVVFFEFDHVIHAVQKR